MNGYSLFTSTIVTGLNWVSLFHTKPAVANISYGAKVDFFRHWLKLATPMDRAAHTAVLAGVTVIAAAGNEAYNADWSSPAREPSVISVSAIDQYDQRASFANFGKVDLFAPGVGVTIAGLDSDIQIGSGDGTSYAAPMVAGAAAIYLHDHPAASPQEVRNALQNGATPDAVREAGSGSANRLLYVEPNSAPPSSYFSTISIPPPSWCGSAANCLGKAQNDLIVGDFNGDGHTDFLSAGGNFDVWLSNADGTVRYAAAVPPPTWCGGSASNCLSHANNHVIVGDFNGDGRTDFLSAGGGFDIWLANPDGTIRYAAAVAAPPWCGSASNCVSQSKNGVVVGDLSHPLILARGQARAQ